MSRAGRGWQGDDPNMLPVHDYLREEYHAAGVDTETLRINSEAANHVQAYLEYERIVGHADNGQLLSEEEYAAFRAKAGSWTLHIRVHGQRFCTQSEPDKSSSTDEREACGRPVDNLCGGGAMYEALGGITRHASLADG
eukprot:gene7570-9015_t